MAQTVIVDISTRGANPVAYTHQGDTGRTIFADIYDNGVAFDVSDYTIKVAAMLPADNGYYVITGNNMVTAQKIVNTTNKICFTLSDDYTLKAGNGILTLIFSTGSGTPTTIRPINIDLRIQKSADGDDTVLGASDWPTGLYDYMDEWLAENEPTEIANLKSELIGSDIFNVSDWENGAISASTGESISNSSRIRTKGYLPWFAQKLRSTNSSVRFLLYAYSNGSYVGGWWGDGTFNSSDVKAFSTIDLNAIYSNPTYANYDFRVAIYISGGTARVETISDIYIDVLPVKDFLNLCVNNSLERVMRIPDSTDFDTLMSAGNYYVENYASFATMTHTPPEAAQGGRLWVGYGTSKSRPYQIWLSFNSQKEPYLYLRVYDGSAWGKWNYIGEPQPVHMRVLGYNIGKFNWGQDGGLSTNVDTKIANYKAFFGKVNPDIMLFAELSTNIDSNEVYDSVSTLLTPLFAYKTKFNENAVFSNHKLKILNNDQGIYLRDNNNAYAGAVSQAVTTINNRSLCLCGGFLRVLGTAQERYEAFVNLLNSLSSYDYSIVYLDTNVLDETERQSIYTAATTAGFTVANGGYFGLKDTLVPTDMFKPIDNIFVRGNVKLKNFYVTSDEYDNLSSDHIPVVVDLTLY